MSKNPDIKVQLSGKDGNVFAVIGAVSKALKRAGRIEAIKPAADESIKAGFASVAAAGYRQAACVIERMEQAGATGGSDTIYFYASTKEEFVKLGRALGTFTKRVDGDSFYLDRQFDGGLKFTVFISRATICKRRLVRTEHIPERVIPASTKEIYEWDCTPSVLTPELPKVEPAIAEQTAEMQTASEELA